MPTHAPPGQTFTLTDPVGLDDIAKRLGVRSQTAHQWRHRGVLPLPLFIVANVPVWDWPAVEAWARETNRLDRAPAPPDPVSDGDDPARSFLLSGRW